MGATGRAIKRSPWQALALWVGIISVPIAVDLYFDRNNLPEWTLSHVLRDHGNVEDPKCEAAFYAAFGAFTYWFLPHIIRPARWARARARAVAAHPSAMKK